jgi:glycosyltransferase involved in cell wall biosynthesis
LAWERSPWQRLLFVNVRVLDSIKLRGGRLAERSDLLPHPVPPVIRLAQRECRRRLGLPEAGRYIGLQAIIDERKAIPEFIAAFRAGTSNAEHRLLLAGRFDPRTSVAVRQANDDLIATGRLLLLDRYLNEDEADWALGALDVVCAPYRRFDALSTVVLRAVAMGRPVLCDDRGWCGEVVRRFGLGWSCDILAPHSFSATVGTALGECRDFVETEAAVRLLAFHSPANFAETWLSGLPRRRTAASLTSWSWVDECATQRTPGD